MRTGFVIAIWIVAGCLAGIPISAASQTVIYTNDNMHEIPDVVNINSKASEMRYVPKLVGTNYMDELWAPADIVLMGDSIEIHGVYCRMNINDDILEIRAKNEVKVIPSYRVKSIHVPNSGKVFMSRSGIGRYGPTGFYEVVYEGGTNVYAHYTTKIRESNYNVALDQGRMDDELVKEKTFYISRGDKLVKLETKKKKLAEQLGGDHVLEYIKEHRIAVDENPGIVQLMDYLDNR